MLANPNVAESFADQGNGNALYNLGLMYARGEGVPQDLVQAHRWTNLAATVFPATKAEYRVLAIRLRDALASLMTPAQLAEAQKLAREWKPG
jgi:TPR repeat protein